MKNWVTMGARLGLIAALLITAGSHAYASPPAKDDGSLPSANETDAETGKDATGLHVPRFASLRSGEINMRTGPGTRYPIEWVLTHKGLPVEIIAEYEVWRKIRDPEGSEGWVHKSALTGKRTAIITGAARDLKNQDNAESESLAHLEVGVVGLLVSCKKDWCKLKFDGIKGYLAKSDFWGAYKAESFD